VQPGKSFKRVQVNGGGENSQKRLVGIARSPDAGQKTGRFQGRVSREGVIGKARRRPKVLVRGRHAGKNSPRRDIQRRDREKNASKREHRREENRIESNVLPRTAPTCTSGGGCQEEK